MGLYLVRFGILPLELEAKAGSRQIRFQFSRDRGQGSIEQHMFDARMIVKVFDVSNGT
jgi:hypothetical protein